MLVWFATLASKKEIEAGRFSRVRAGEFFYPTCIEKELAPAHPCKGKTATECRRRFMVAVT